jgi:site-specific recombinase XerC
MKKPVVVSKFRIAEHETGWKSRLQELLDANLDKRVNGKPASHKTCHNRATVLFQCFNLLHDLGFRIQDPVNLGNRHIELLCKEWHTQGKKASTMQERLSVLRIFSGWIGKPNMVGQLCTYLPNVDPKQLRVQRIAIKSKSWTANGIDTTEYIHRADQLDPIMGAILRMELAFGLRREEAVRIRPWKSDLGTDLRLYPGETKNGRPRDIPIETEIQRSVLDYVKSLVKKTHRLGWHELGDLYKSLRRYDRRLEQLGISKSSIGVSAHGLRAEYAENEALRQGLIPPSLGGFSGQMARDERQLIQSKVSESLGHSRINVTGAYYGSFERTAKDSVVESLLAFGVQVQTRPARVTVRFATTTTVATEFGPIDCDPGDAILTKASGAVDVMQRMRFDREFRAVGPTSEFERICRTGQAVQLKTDTELPATATRRGLSIKGGEWLVLLDEREILILADEAFRDSYMPVSCN